jgi:hypothetical protein
MCAVPKRLPTTGVGCCCKACRKGHGEPTEVGLHTCCLKEECIQGSAGGAVAVCFSATAVAQAQSPPHKACDTCCSVYLCLASAAFKAAAEQHQMLMHLFESM